MFVKCRYSKKCLPRIAKIQCIVLAKRRLYKYDIWDCGFVAAPPDHRSYQNNPSLLPSLTLYESERKSNSNLERGTSDALKGCIST